MRTLNYDLKQLCRHCREGSYATQSNRERMLTLIANELHAMGYRKMQSRSIKPKHIEALVQKWQDNSLSIGTIRTGWLRSDGGPIRSTSKTSWPAPTSTTAYQNRCFVAKKSKAKEITQEQLARIKDAYVRMSLELQRAFGLRREEAMKFIPSYADQGDHIRLKGSWTKGGKPRTVPVRTEGQREVLNRARGLAGSNSLIPNHRSYVQHLRVYENSTVRAGLSKLHGLRHAYAQERYEELTGWKCPVTGGSDRISLSREQRERDKEVRLIIS